MRIYFAFLVFVASIREKWIGPGNSYTISCFDRKTKIEKIENMFCPTESCPILTPETKLENRIDAVF